MWSRTSLLLLTIALGSCGTSQQREAQEIVARELGRPGRVEFRNVRSKRTDPDVVCGEVDASDRPTEGWRYFVAYTAIGRAVVTSTGQTITARAEMNNPLLRGEAERFYRACD